MFIFACKNKQKCLSLCRNHKGYKNNTKDYEYKDNKNN